jgi:hypothetical protein
MKDEEILSRWKDAMNEEGQDCIRNNAADRAAIRLWHSRDKEMKTLKATIKDRMNFENEQEKFISKLRGEIAEARSLGFNEGQAELLGQMADRLE